MLWKIWQANKQTNKQTITMPFLDLVSCLPPFPKIRGYQCYLWGCVYITLHPYPPPPPSLMNSSYPKFMVKESVCVCDTQYAVSFTSVASRNKPLKEEWISYICHEVLNVSLCSYIIHIILFCLNFLINNFSFPLVRESAICIRITLFTETSKDRMFFWQKVLKWSWVSLLYFITGSPIKDFYE